MWSSRALDARRSTEALRPGASAMGVAGRAIAVMCVAQCFRVRRKLRWTTLAARGESLAAFDERCIPTGCVAPRSNTPGILGRLALPAGRLARLGATPDFHHGLLTRISSYLLHVDGDWREAQPHRCAARSRCGSTECERDAPRRDRVEQHGGEQARAR